VEQKLGRSSSSVTRDSRRGLTVRQRDVDSTTGSKISCDWWRNTPFMTQSRRLVLSHHDLHRRN